jgi:UDPglucose 6-dehydrogenase
MDGAKQEQEVAVEKVPVTPELKEPPAEGEVVVATEVAPPIPEQQVKPVIGIMGMGKLGLPVALAIEAHGYTVIGNDVSPEPAKYLAQRRIPFKEAHIQGFLDQTQIAMVDLHTLVGESDMIFCAIQTPHEAKYEGTTRLPDDRADFNYAYLKKAVKDVAAEAKMQKKKVNLVVISTCLPGTYERDIKPLLNEYVNYVYNPFFIAMGTVIPDFLQPEFVLLGVEDEDQAQQMAKFYHSIHRKPIFYTDYTTAEGIKVFYNTFITMKTVFANMTGEMAAKLGMNADHIFEALSLATDRLLSPKYLKAGMGDGGGCHPRDNIALSHIAKEVELSHNIFEDMMKAREDHAAWLAEVAADTANKFELPLILLGKSFKPETNIQTGSPALLMANILKEKGVKFQHFENTDLTRPAVYFIATQHEKYQDYAYPIGSVVVDPFRYIVPREGIDVVAIGKN